jgi:hypothetical protein
VPEVEVSVSYKTGNTSCTVQAYFITISCLEHSPLHFETLLYSALTDKVERNCHFPAPGWNCMTHRQALQDFPDTSQVSLHKNNKINSGPSIWQQFLLEAGKRQSRSPFARGPSVRFVSKERRGTQQVLMFILWLQQLLYNVSDWFNTSVVLYRDN